MAPEQAKGKAVDKRADIWSWAVVLYELLTGEQLFRGDDIPDTLAQVLTQPPDLKKVPEKVRKLLRRCLEKDPKQRLRDIGEARFWLDNDVAVSTSRQPSRLTAALIIAVLLLALAIGATIHFRERPPERTSARFQIPVPGQTYIPSAPVLSPDGRTLAFVLVGTDGKSLLWVRSLDSLQMHSLSGTDGASTLSSPFWSPDGRFIAFFADAKLKRIDASGGPPAILCNASAATGGAWNQNGEIVIGQIARGLSRVRDSGGVPAQIPGSSGSPGSVSFLPDGRHIIYSMSASPLLESNITLSTLDGKDSKRLLSGSSLIAYSRPGGPREQGHLMFLRESTLMAQPFDERALELVGDAFSVAEQVAWFSVSENGALAYRSVGTGGIDQLVWFDRAGKPLGVVGSPGTYNDLVLSPDGKRIAITTVQKSGNMDISLIDVSRGIPTPITSDPGREWDPVWSSDGSRIAFASQRGGPDQIYLKNSSGIGEEKLLLKSNGRQRPMSWSPDGKFLLLTNAEATSTVYNLYVLPVIPEHPGEELKATPYFTSPFNITQGQFSPGRANSQHWVAYTSNEDGESQIYIQSFPAGATRLRISTNGGVQPRWRADGKELYYISLDRKLVAVDIKTSPSLEAGAPKELFQTSMVAGGGFVYVFRYDVAPDGRFLVLSPIGKESPTAPPITVWLNWTAGLKR